MDNFFEQALLNMPDDAKESFYKTVFMNDDSAYAEKVRLAYYKANLAFMGEGVRIGKGVQIGDGAALIARGEGASSWEPALGCRSGSIWTRSVPAPVISKPEAVSISVQAPPCSVTPDWRSATTPFWRKISR